MKAALSSGKVETLTLAGPRTSFKVQRLRLTLAFFVKLAKPCKLSLAFDSLVACRIFKMLLGFNASLLFHPSQWTATLTSHLAKAQSEGTCIYYIQDEIYRASVRLFGHDLMNQTTSSRINVRVS